MTATFRPMAIPPREEEDDTGRKFDPVDVRLSYPERSLSGPSQADEVRAAAAVVAPVAYELELRPSCNPSYPEPKAKADLDSGVGAERSNGVFAADCAHEAERIISPSTLRRISAACSTAAQKST